MYINKSKSIRPKYFFYIRIAWTLQCLRFSFCFFANEIKIFKFELLLQFQILNGTICKFPARPEHMAVPVMTCVLQLLPMQFYRPDTVTERLVMVQPS